MKNKKETRKCILHEIKMFLILIFIIILIALYFNYFNITNKFNPDKEICYYEHPAVGEIKVGLTDCKGKLFTANCDLVKLKKRDKTNSELEIEYCNNNPDDSERCNCLEYDSSPDNLYEIKIRNTILIASGAYLKENHNISICIKSNPKTECEKGNENYILINESHIGNKVTICVLKTEVEKLMDKDCDWLHNAIDNHVSFEKYKLEDKKQAWRNKKCQI